MGGFKVYNPSLKDGLEKGVYQYKNVISPFSSLETIKKTKKNKHLSVDENYGLVYDRTLTKVPAHIYGRECDIPQYSGDQLENFGFLRVPFRKIPRIKIYNRDELDKFVKSIESRDPNLKLLFRGQNTEYYVDRGAKEKELIFADANALEPSLIPSAVRRGILMEDIMPLWNSMLQSYLGSKRLGSSSLKDSDLIRFKSSPEFALFSLSLAQHYGLPSVGLDATDDIETALFFATYKYRLNNGIATYEYNLNNLKKEPVIYVLSPAERFHLNYSDYNPECASFLRPDKQSAKFLHTGWGLNKNNCARHIWVALYLDTEGDFGNIPTPGELFPESDSFVDHIKPIIEEINKGHLNPYFEGFYTF
uniref:FRG domain-containing protein n=1 Tax=Marinomonas sp. (strain MWYL1) TaxID=400668 RepID=A6VW43_MARMS